MIQEVQDPRQYGVAEVAEASREILKVKRVEEKPSKPVSRLAIMPLYIFNPVIFSALKGTPPGKGGEIQLRTIMEA